MKKAAGFTLVELLVTISVIALLSTIGLASFISFNRRQIINQATLKVVEGLRLAQSLAANNQKPPDCSPTLIGYVFSVDQAQRKYVIYASCNVPIEIERVPIVDQSLSSSLIISGATSIRFKVLRQGINFSGGNTITLTGFGITKTITINDGGEIDVTTN